MFRRANAVKTNQMKNETQNQNSSCPHIGNSYSLFEKICTCGMEYEKCTLPVNNCKEFQDYRNTVIIRHKFSGWEKLI
jgi:hypothetical protein